jgi:hypothetical protein
VRNAARPYALRAQSGFWRSSSVCKERSAAAALACLAQMQLDLSDRRKRVRFMTTY